jgi:hypothetical protein
MRAEALAAAASMKAPDFGLAMGKTCITSSIEVAIMPWYRRTRSMN